MATLLKPNTDFATETRIPVESPIDGYTAYIVEARSPRGPWADYTPAVVINGRTITGKTYNLPGAAQAEIDDFFASLIEEQQQIQVEVDEAEVAAFVADVAAANPEPPAVPADLPLDNELDDERGAYEEWVSTHTWPYFDPTTNELTIPGLPTDEPATCPCGAELDGDGCTNKACVNYPPTLPPAIAYNAYLGGFAWAGAPRAYNTHTEADMARAEWLAEQTNADMLTLA